MINNTEQLTTQDELQLPFDWHGDMPIPKEDQDTFRATIVDRLKSGLPLFCRPEEANGDSFLSFSATLFVLRLLCRQEGIDPNKIQLRVIDFHREDPPDFFNITAFRNKLHYKHWDYDLTNPRLPRSFYARECYLLAEDLGIQLTQQDFAKVPALARPDKGPLSSYAGDEKLAEEGEKLISTIKEKVPGRRIYVIAQAGSFIEKRYSDVQVLQLSQKIKKLDKTAYVVVISDKNFLRTEVTADKDIFPQGFPLETRFPIEDPKFRAEVQSELHDESIDEVVLPATMNDALRYFYAADMTLVTDSFWAHTGAAANALKTHGKLNKESFAVLFTLADPKGWGIAGAKNIQSESSKRVFGGSDQPKSSRTETVMGYNQYYEAIGAQDPPNVDLYLNDPRRGVRQSDMDQVLDFLESRLTGTRS